MKLTEPRNVNYAATVVRVRSVVNLPGLDNLVGVPVQGFQALTSKTTQVGDLVVAFTAETQLSPLMAFNNNLYRHANQNSDPEAKGYLEDNRRVRAIKLRGHRSDALLLDLDSLEWTGVDVSELREGDTFDVLNGHEICQKYEIKVPRERVANGQVVKRRPRVDEAMFPKHFDTANYFRTPDIFDDEDYVTITQKLHGTSVRIAHTLVDRKLTWKDKVAKFFGVKVQEKEYAYVYGSRTVTKDPDNPFESAGFYGHDIYSEVGQRLRGLLPKGTIVYGEIIGWVGNRPIQPGYTYQIPQGQAELYVYRVARVGEDGRVVDLSWDQVKEFCTSIGVKHVPELARTFYVSDAFVQLFLDRRFVDMYDDNPDVVPTEEGTVDEGICLRREALIPTIVKAKSPKFLEHETKQLDKGEVDIEVTELDVAALDAELKALVDEFAGVSA